MATPTTPGTPIGGSRTLNDRTRENIRVMKVLRRISDEQIAQLGGFTSRQTVADRVGGRTVLTLTDVERIASALEVSAEALIGTQSELMRWVEEHGRTNGDEIYLPPKKGRMSPGKKAAAAKSAPATRKRSK